MPPQMYMPYSTIPIRSEGTSHPLCTIYPSVNYMDLPIDASGLWNVDFARALLRATIALPDFKGICIPLEDVMMWSYASHYEVTSVHMFPFLCSYVLLRLTSHDLYTLA